MSQEDRQSDKQEGSRGVRPSGGDRRPSDRGREGKDREGGKGRSQKQEAKGSQGLYVELRDNERIEVPLKVFKRKVMRSGLLKDLRRKEAYVKPSDARKLKRKAALGRRRREEQRVLVPDPFI